MAYISRLFKWGGSSLIGHVVLFELSAALPLSIWTIAALHSDATDAIATKLCDKACP
jgi:hypothetical protein